MTIVQDDTEEMQGFDFQPILKGEHVTLRPLVADNFESVYAAASDPEVWAMHPDRLRYLRDVFKTNFYDSAVASGSAFVITDSKTGAVIGSSRYYDWDAQLREVAIGYTFLATSHWGGTWNGELKALMLAHAFRWADKVWFHIGSDNLRSRRAIEKIGARYSHDEIKVFQGVDYPHSYYWIAKPS